MLQNRNMRSTSETNDFARWMEQRKTDNLEGGLASEEEDSLLGNLGAIQDGIYSQFTALGNSIPFDSGFRQRLTYAIYLLIASLLFMLIAIFVGLPLLLIKPSKFIICISLSTLLGASSVVVMQKPTVFISNMVKNGLDKSLPLVLLMVSLLSTVYVSVFIHKYVYVVIFGSIQMYAMFYYLSSYIPGGTQGLNILLKSSYYMVSTALTPCIYVCKQTILSFFKKLFT